MYHTIYNIREFYALAEISGEIYRLLHQQNYKVEAILNLDVGSYNILQVYDPGGKMILREPVGLSQATNLIVYSAGG